MDEVVGTGHDAAGPAGPPGGIGAFVARSLAATTYRWYAEVRVDAGVGLPCRIEADAAAVAPVAAFTATLAAACLGGGDRS